jgi:alpha-beta hydrolase superfamily lysophospholipase
MRRLLISLFLMVSTPAFALSNYAREQKWADEITPSIVVGDPVYLEQENGHRFLAIYTEVDNAAMGVVVVHGMGLHPNWEMIGTLRRRLADQGYTTLSIQMPILAQDVGPDSYSITFPEAAERLQLAVNYLKERGYRRTAIVSHSMGAAMSYRFLVDNPAAVDAWAALGMYGPDTYAGIEIPVLDLNGANEWLVQQGFAANRKASLTNRPQSRQVIIPDTGHFYAGHEEAMVSAVKAFLDSLN